jgi:enhancing lycopene biosynthesis protein 2
MQKAAVVLCGSGFKDGSEIREAVGVLWALSEQGVEAGCFALDAPQADVVNCLTGAVSPGETRNQLVESARIARGKVRPLAAARAGEFDFLVLPGGFGAAKNLCSFASQGAKGKVDPEVQRVLQDFREEGKPIGAVCIAPAVLALAFPGQGLELTLGAEGEAAEEIRKLGHKHVPKQPSAWHLDRKHKIATTPAYMYDDAPLHDVFAGIRGMVAELCRLAAGND